MKDEEMLNFNPFKIKKDQKVIQPKKTIQFFQRKKKGCDDSHSYWGDIAEVKNHLTGKKALVFSNGNVFKTIVASKNLEYEFGTEKDTSFSYDEAIQKAKELTEPDIYSIRGLAFKIRDHFQRFIKTNTPETEKYNSRWSGEFEILDRAKSSYPYRYWLIHYGKPLLKIKIYNLEEGDLKPQLVREGLINSRSDERGINACLVAFGIDTIGYSKEKGKLVKC